MLHFHERAPRVVVADELVGGPRFVTSVPAGGAHAPTLPVPYRRSGEQGLATEHGRTNGGSGER